MEALMRNQSQSRPEEDRHYNAQAQNHQSTIKELNNNITKAEKKQKESDYNNRRLEEEVKELQERLEELTDDYEWLSKLNDENEEKLCDFEDQFHELEAERKGYNKKIKQLKEALTQCEQDVEKIAYEKNIKKLEKALHEVKESKIIQQKQWEDEI